MGYFKERNTVWGWLHFILGIIHLAFGIGVWGGLSDSIDNTGQEIYFMQPAIIKTDDEAGFSVQIKKTHVGVLSPILIHALVSILTGFSHLISHYYYKEYGVCTSRPNHIRWTEYSITATLMTLSAYVSLGEGNILFLVSIMLMGVLLQSCGWLIEKYCQLQEADGSSQKGGRKWLVWYWFFLIGLIVELAIVVPLIVLTAKMENKKDGINESLIIYTIYYSLFAVNCFYDAHVMTQVTNSEFVDSTKTDEKTNKKYVLDRAFMLSDERYAVLSFTSKIALFWITIGMVMRQSSTSDEGADAWYGAIWSGIVIPTVGLLIFIWYQRTDQNWFTQEYIKLDLESKTRDYKPQYLATTNIKDEIGSTPESLARIGSSQKATKTSVAVMPRGGLHF